MFLPAGWIGEDTLSSPSNRRRKGSAGLVFFSQPSSPWPWLEKQSCSQSWWFPYESQDWITRPQLDFRSLLLELQKGLPAPRSHCQQSCLFRARNEISSVFLLTLLLLFIKTKRFSKEICTRYRMHQLFHLKHPSSSSDCLFDLYMFPVSRECCYLRRRVARDSMGVPLHLSGRIGLS